MMATSPGQHGQTTNLTLAMLVGFTLVLCIGIGGGFATGTLFGDAVRTILGAGSDRLHEIVVAIERVRR